MKRINSLLLALAVIPTLSVLTYTGDVHAILTMNPEILHGQWLLVTLTAGIGGSLLSICAAGVALMGVVRESTPSYPLQKAPAVALGHMASVYVHLLINRAMF